MRIRIAWLVVGLSLCLLAMGALRLAATHPCALTSLAGFATPGYIAVVVVFAFLLVRTGLPLNRVGFGVRLGRRHILLAIVAIAILRVTSVTLEPIWEALLGGPRNLERFSEVEGSTGSLAALMAASWTIAAFGEEIAYRIVLMRGLSFALGDTRKAKSLALVLQALMFGLIHAYQGPTGIASSATSGLVFGAVTLVGRWSIWPAAIAHGVNNTIGILALYRGQG
jgi:membrane protease YdiL (CAAX protease family)